MLLKILDELNLPPLLPREDMLKILQEEIFGYMPPKPESIAFEVEEDIIFDNGGNVPYDVVYDK